jgi:2-oxo-4-hydroxy-4-carboxy-5-ureidoimidazoline decarboxylase
MDVLAQIDTAPARDAETALHRCCGSPAWVARMLARRPFGSLDALLQAARDEWFALTPEDWKTAFRHHPKIGDREALRTKYSSTRDLAAREQAGVRDAAEDVLEALADANRRYEERFGFIFIVCATGRSAGEMLALLRQRLAHDPATEILVAAEEQAKITALRLRRR